MGEGVRRFWNSVIHAGDLALRATDAYRTLERGGDRAMQEIEYRRGKEARRDMKIEAEEKARDEDPNHKPKKIKPYRSGVTVEDEGSGERRYSFGVTQEDINKYVENAKTKENTQDYKKYAKVSQKLIEEVKDDIDLKGYAHALRDNDIRHIFISHGENTSEKYPVTERDIEMIPYIVENYDKVFFRMSNHGKPSLLYVKVFDNNNVYYIEQAVENYNKEKLLINKQMIITGSDDIPSNYVSTIEQKESKIDFLTDLRRIREEHAQSVSQSYGENIPQSDEIVNRNSENSSKKRLSISDTELAAYADMRERMETYYRTQMKLAPDYTMTGKMLERFRTLHRVYILRYPSRSAARCLSE